MGRCDSGDGEDLEGSLFVEMGGEIPAVQASHAVTYEMDLLAWVGVFDLLEEDFGTVDWAACCWYASYEDVCACLGEDLFETSPVCYLELEGGHSEGWTDCD